MICKWCWKEFCICGQVRQRKLLKSLGSVYRVGVILEFDRKGKGCLQPYIQGFSCGYRKNRIIYEEI